MKLYCSGYLNYNLIEVRIKRNENKIVLGTICKSTTFHNFVIQNKLKLDGLIELLNIKNEDI